MAELKKQGSQNVVKVTLDATYVKGDFILLDQYYVCLLEGGDSGDEVSGWIRGVPEITKNSATEVIAKGDAIEYVSKNTVQKYSSGTKIGKAHEASGNGTATVLVELMPELN